MLGALVVVAVGGVAGLAGALTWVNPGVVCVSVIVVLNDAAAVAARREDAGNGKIGRSIGDAMSGEIGVLRMLLRMVGSLSGVEGVEESF
jgi:hypothetical protein